MDLTLIKFKTLLTCSSIALVHYATAGVLLQTHIAVLLALMLCLQNMTSWLTNSALTLPCN